MVDHYISSYYPQRVHSVWRRSSARPSPSQQFISIKISFTWTSIVIFHFPIRDFDGDENNEATARHNTVPHIFGKWLQKHVSHHARWMAENNAQPRGRKWKINLKILAIKLATIFQSQCTIDSYMYYVFTLFTVRGIRHSIGQQENGGQKRQRVHNVILIEFLTLNKHKIRIKIIVKMWLQ